MPRDKTSLFSLSEIDAELTRRDSWQGSKYENLIKLK